DVVHLNYAPHSHDVIFGNELEALAAKHPRFKLTQVYTRTRDDAGSAQRHFGAQQLQRVCPDWRERDTYACGPQSLLAALETHWREAGIPRRLHIERFHA